MVSDIHRHILGEGQCVEDLRALCKDIGARLSGSPEADDAILWGARTLREAGAPEVRMQTVMVPHWERMNLDKLDKEKQHLFHPIVLANGAGRTHTNYLMCGIRLLFCF